MKKRTLSMALALCLALSLAVPAYATSSTPTVSEELYQEYVEIAETVSQETGINVAVCPISEMTKVYTAEEFRGELLNFCNIIADIQKPSIVPFTSSTTNPSASGTGRKDLTVSTSRNIDGGYFLWRIVGHANIVVSGSSYVFNDTAIDSVTMIQSPAFGSFTSSRYGAASLVSQSATTRKYRQQVTLKQSGLAITKDPISLYVTFQLKTSTGVVTLTSQKS